MKRLVLVLLFICGIYLNANAQNCNCNQFDGDGITTGGSDAWFWRIYREGSTSNPLNESLLFARKRGSSSEEQIQMRLNRNGALGVGTTNIPSGFMLSVNGGVIAEEIKIINDVPNSDYVFENEYKLMPLHKLEKFVNQNKHLPKVPDSREFKRNGYKVGEMDDILLRKIEELTLYLIEQNRRINLQDSTIKAQREMIEKLLDKN